MSAQEGVAPTVDELAARLEEDPVVIDDRFGNGHTEEVATALHRLVDAADVPTYVVLAPVPDGVAGSEPAADLARQLQQRLGEQDATFAVLLGTDGYESAVVGLGEAPGEDEAFAAQLEHGPSGGGADAGVSAVGVLARDLQAAVEGERMSGDDWDAYAEQETWAEPVWDVGDDYPEAGDAAFVVSLLALLAAGLVLVVRHGLTGLVAAHRGHDPVGRTPARGAGGKGGKGGKGGTGGDGAPAYRSPTRSVRDADAPTVRATLTSALDVLAEKVSAGLADVEDADVRARVEGSQDTARRIAAHRGSTRADLPDLVGALVLVRIADRALDDVRHGREPAPWRACLVDPRHGRAKRERDLPVADRSLTVPVCGECAQLPAERLRPLRVAPGRFGGVRPYLETDSVWARTGYGAFTDDLWREVSAELDGERS